MGCNRGRPIRGEVNSANASAGVTATLYPNASATAITLARNEFLTITDFWFVSTAGGKAAFVGDGGTDGYRIFSGTFEALGGLGMNLTVPITLPVGSTPVLTADAGQVDLVFTGYLTKA